MVEAQKLFKSQKCQIQSTLSSTLRKGVDPTKNSSSAK